MIKTQSRYLFLYASVILFFSLYLLSSQAISQIIEVTPSPFSEEDTFVDVKSFNIGSFEYIYNFVIEDHGTPVEASLFTFNDTGANLIDNLGLYLYQGFNATGTPVAGNDGNVFSTSIGFAVGLGAGNYSWLVLGTAAEENFNYKFSINSSDPFTIPQVPLPAAIWLLGGGILGIFTFFKRNQKS